MQTFISNASRSTALLVSLQYIRAVAAWLAVFHYYMQIVHNFESSSSVGRFFACHGSFGVELFFVLSGVVMVLPVSHGVPNVLMFFWRRVRRLLPAYWSAT